MHSFAKHHQKIQQNYDHLAKSIPHCAQTLGWYSTFSQEQRFHALLSGLDWHQKTVLDVGCGLADLYPYIQKEGFSGTYTGLDFSQEMIRSCQSTYPHVRFICADLLDDTLHVGADIVVASGVFAHLPPCVEDYFNTMVARLMTLASHCVAFNLLSDLTPQNEKDASFMYYNPAQVVQWIIKQGHYFELKHHYLPNDMTVVIYKK